jgi:arginase
MMNQKTVPFIGYASGIAAGDPGCGDGPVVLSKSNLCAELNRSGINSQWQDLLYPIAGQAVLSAVIDLCTRLAKQTFALTKQRQLFTVFGGDHSCAIGTWSGVAAAIYAQGPLGLIWIDAHMDSHTPETSESSNIHGMPVACLLGHGTRALTSIIANHAKILPQHISLLGIRSYEEGEAELIKRLGIRVYDMVEIKQRGFNAVFQEAMLRASQGTAGYGISIDLDGIDPADAPGVGTPCVEGIKGSELCEALTAIRHDSHLLGMEITEFNPHHDRDKRTEKMIQDLLVATFKDFQHE